MEIKSSHKGIFNIYLGIRILQLSSCERNWYSNQNSLCSWYKPISITEIMDLHYHPEESKWDEKDRNAGFSRFVISCQKRKQDEKDRNVGYSRFVISFQKRKRDEKGLCFILVLY